MTDTQLIDLDTAMALALLLAAAIAGQLLHYADARRRRAPRPPWDPPAPDRPGPEAGAEAPGPQSSQSLADRSGHSSV